jgi:hypothetical protein
MYSVTGILIILKVHLETAWIKVLHTGDFVITFGVPAFIIWGMDQESTTFVIPT